MEESRRDMFWEKNEGEVRRGPQGREKKLKKWDIKIN